MSRIRKFSKALRLNQAKRLKKFNENPDVSALNIYIKLMEKVQDTVIQSKATRLKKPGSSQTIGSKLKAFVFPGALSSADVSSEAKFLRKLKKIRKKAGVQATRREELRRATAEGSEGVVFRRIGGRIVPIRKRKK